MALACSDWFPRLQDLESKVDSMGALKPANMLYHSSYSSPFAHQLDDLEGDSAGNHSLWCKLGQAALKPKSLVSASDLHMLLSQLLYDSQPTCEQPTYGHCKSANLRVL